MAKHCVCSLVQHGVHPIVVLCVIAFFFLQENGTSSSDLEKNHAEAKVPVSVVKLLHYSFIRKELILHTQFER